MTAWLYEASTVAGGVVVAILLIHAWQWAGDAIEERRGRRVRGR